MAMELQVTHQKVTPATQSDLPEGRVTGTCGRRGSRGLGGAELTLGAVQGGGWPRGRFGGGELAGTTPGRCPRVALLARRWPAPRRRTQHPCSRSSSGCRGHRRGQGAAGIVDLNYSLPRPFTAPCVGIRRGSAPTMEAHGQQRPTEKQGLPATRCLRTGGLACRGCR